MCFRYSGNSQQAFPGLTVRAAHRIFSHSACLHPWVHRPRCNSELSGDDHITDMLAEGMKQYGDLSSKVLVLRSAPRQTHSFPIVILNSGFCRPGRCLDPPCKTWSNGAGNEPPGFEESLGFANTCSTVQSSARRQHVGSLPQLEQASHGQQDRGEPVHRKALGGHREQAQLVPSELQVSEGGLCTVRILLPVPGPSFRGQGSGHPQGRSLGARLSTERGGTSS